MSNLDKYIGIPFLSGGRDFKGCDCYGLIKLFYQEELNIKLPDYYAPALNCQAVNIVYESAKINRFWRQFEGNSEPPKYSIIALKFNSPFVNHVGIYLGNGKFLHTRGKIGACITSINSPAWKKLIEAYYVWEGAE